MTSKHHETINFLSLVVVGLALWQALSWRFNDFLLPSPLIVIQEAWSLVVSGVFMSPLLITAARVAAGFGAAILFSFSLAFISHRLPSLKTGFKNVIQIINTIPSVIWIFLFVIVIGPFSGAIVASIFMNTFPRIYNSLHAGLQNLSQKYRELTQIYQVPTLSRIFKINLPQLWVVIFPAIRNDLINAWKVAIISEVFGVGNGLGYQLYYSFGLFSLKKVFAWTIIFISTILIFEIFLLTPLEKITFKWKSDEN